MLSQLKAQDNAAAQAMVWLISADQAAADWAIRRMRAYRYPGQVDTFHIFHRLSEFGLAYDWLYAHPKFTQEIKAEVRAQVAPLACAGLQASDDHVFHNYIWMSAGGTWLWALATAGEDEQSNRIFTQIHQRFNSGLYPAWRYLDGLPSEPMGYWALYVFTPGLWSVLAAQSAFDTGLVEAIQTEQGNWLNRHFENLVHSTLPDLRYVPWGDLQSGPNGGVTHEMAGVIDAATWALGLPQGAWFSRWLQTKRGLERFHGETAVYYMLYSQHLETKPQRPPLSFLAGNWQSGHFLARSGWEDGATAVSFRCTDHFGDHNHYDQGSFMIYRNGLLAVDPPVYRRIRGPQQQTEHHNTLLLGGQPQRPVRGQWFKTVAEFKRNLRDGRMLETGDILFHRDAGRWAGVAGQFTQAYAPGIIQRCVRQMLFLRPDKVVVVDQLVAPSGMDLPSVEWLLQLPRPPVIDGAMLWVANGKSWLRCQAVWPSRSAPAVAATPVNTHRASFRYQGKDKLTLVHLLEVGDGAQPCAPTRIKAVQSDRAIVATVDGTSFNFAGEPRFELSEK
jgi:hypothetical protein